LILIFSGLISLIFNFQSFSISNQKQIKLIDDDIESNDDQITHQTKTLLEHRTRSNDTSDIDIGEESREDFNKTFNPLPYIEGPTPENGDIYKVLPGEAFIDFKVYNMGNGEDNFEIKAQVGVTTYERKLLERKGWKAVVYTGKYTRVLKPGEYQVVTVQLSVPSMVRSGSPCAVKLTATSVRDPNHPDSSKNITYYVFIDLFRNVSFADEKIEPIYMYPDSEESTLFKIRNTGNYYDNTIKVNVTSIPEDWEVSIDSSDIPVGGIPINGTADIEVIVKTPKQVFEAIYCIKLSLMTNNEKKDEATIPVHVLKMQNISLECTQIKKCGNISEKINYKISVKNNGNSKESIDFNYSFITQGMDNMGWNIIFSENPFILYPYEFHELIVSVSIPFGAFADTDFSTLDVQDGYLLQINAISQYDNKVTAKKELEIIVNPIYNFSFSKPDDNIHLILYHLQQINYTIEILNNGNARDFINIDYKSNHKWISIPYRIRDILPGKTEKFSINFHPPSQLNVGEYVYIIWGQSLKNNSVINNLELTIEIINSDLELTELMLDNKSFSEANVKQGDIVLINALITNVGDLDCNNKTSNENVIIKFMEGSNYIGETTISYIPSKRTGNENSIWVSYPWKVGKAREYSIVVILDPDLSFPESNMKNNELMEKIKVEAVDEKIVDKDNLYDDKDDDKIMIPDISTILVIVFIFLLFLNIIIWLNILKMKGTNK